MLFVAFGVQNPASHTFGGQIRGLLKARVCDRRASQKETPNGTFGHDARQRLRSFIVDANIVTIGTVTTVTAIESETLI
jgi:hypothetical protein